MPAAGAAVVHSGIVVAGAAEVHPGVVDAAVQEGVELGIERAAAAAPALAEVAEVWLGMRLDFVTMEDSAPVGLAAAEAGRSDFAVRIALVGTLPALVAGTVDRLPGGSAERCEPGLALSEILFANNQ